MIDHEPEPTPPPGPVPRECRLIVGDRSIPLLPVYVGRTPQQEAGGELAHLWMLWVHPDWPEETVELANPWSVRLDVLPARSSAVLAWDERDGRRVVSRHPG